jgi:hypothetical protein
MGLDTFAARYTPEYLATPKEKWEELNPETRPNMTVDIDHSAFSEVPNVLCGGIFSGNGASNSFRGKVYSDVIQYLTGESLYQELIPPETVRAMADSLESKLAMELSRKFYASYEISPEELKALAIWFRVVADQGGVVIGWW